MQFPIKLMDIELSVPIPNINGLNRYKQLQCLVRLHESPIGFINLPIVDGYISSERLREEIINVHQRQIINHLLTNALTNYLQPNRISPENFLEKKEDHQFEVSVPITLAICTRDRIENLSRCLISVRELTYQNLEIIVIDNAPTSQILQHLIETNHPSIRYINEPRPGLNWARNRAIAEARGEIVVFTDDDVEVDKNWIKAIATLFSNNPGVMAMTGLIVPLELETQAQVLFEMYGGFGRGFRRKWFRFSDDILPWQILGTGQLGTGANMAFRRSVFQSIGLFDTALDVGTITNGGGDLEIFFRVLKAGYHLVYEPSAIVRHCHRIDFRSLKIQLQDNGTGFMAYCNRSIKAFPSQRAEFCKLWLWWIRHWFIKRVRQSLSASSEFPVELILSELTGALKGINIYAKSKKWALKIENDFDLIVSPEADNANVSLPDKQIKPVKAEDRTGVYFVDLDARGQTIDNFRLYKRVKLFINWGKQSLGSVEISTQFSLISIEEFVQLIVENFSQKLLDLNKFAHFNLGEQDIFKKINREYHKIGLPDELDRRLAPEITASVIIATHDRPQELYLCLKSLVNQITNREIEIIVVDNNPKSNLTFPVVAEFPNVLYKTETRKGLSYARNAGIIASKGKIIVSTDDDVIVPSDWIEELLSAFSRPDIMVVTGNVFPLELNTKAQQLFEIYGGLGRGFDKREVGRHWFEGFKTAVPTWELGACANAAFRAEVFSNSIAGMLCEILGAGTPTGCSEDTYAFYKVLQHGYTIVYNPNAYVWHKHRNDMKSLKRQLFNYSKGHIAYHLHTWRIDKDWRGLRRVILNIPIWQLTKFYRIMRGHNAFPMSLLFQEILGTICGPFAYIQSCLRVHKLGKS